MTFKWFQIIIVGLFLPLYGQVEQSIIPLFENLYIPSPEGSLHKQNKLRVMSYNMLYNEYSAEKKLPEKHRWENRKTRLLEYIAFTNADIIGSQELQKDQILEVSRALGQKYRYYGLKSRVSEARSDTNAIFYNPQRLKLIDARTIPYNDFGGNAYTFCFFEDIITNVKFVVINTKLSYGFTWSAHKKRLEETKKLQEIVSIIPEEIPVIITGDFNNIPILDGKTIEEALAENQLIDSRKISELGHYGPLTSINNSKFTLTPFTGPELSGFILDHILVSNQTTVVVHGIDIAKVNGEYPSDHFPVIADIIFNH